jgi:glycolate oxidase FAD binding subunit
LPSLSETLVGLLGREAVVSPGDLAGYPVDGVVAEAVALPSHVQGVSDVMRLASERRLAVVPRGGGTQMGLGNPPTRLDLVLGLERLDGLVFHEPADLVAAAEAGMTVDALGGELARHGQTLPLEAPLASKATVGGVLAANAGGPSRLAFGGLRDWLIGLRVVRPSGEVTKSGGRVVKNVTGYDLNKLYTGSLGTLGVIVEATFKVAPLPAGKGTVVASMGSLEAAVELARQVLGLAGQPQALHVMDRGAAGRVPELNMPRSEAVVAALFSGNESSVGRKMSQAAGLLATGGASNIATLVDDEGDRVWRAVTDLGWAGEGGPRLMVRVGLLPSRVAAFVASVDGGRRTRLPRGIVADPGSGLVRVFEWAEEMEPRADELVEDTIRTVRQAAGILGGYAVVERCPLSLKRKIDVWGDDVGGLDLMRRVKREMDPKGILSPGRFVGGI